jgi:hypothetical protein
MSRSCNGCTKCCRTMTVKELNKPAYKWCQHCSFEGCTIYPDRPASCVAFECMWLQDESIPDELRPDRSRVVLAVNPDSTAVTAFVDPRESSAWQQGMMGQLLIQISNQMPVLISCGEERKAMVNPDIGPVTFTEEQADGTIRTYIPRAQT